MNKVLEDLSVGFKVTRIGEFELKGHVVVSDPCYKLGTWCMGEVDVKSGIYEAFTISDRGVLRILVMRKGEENADYGGFLDFDVGVDSGMVGIYDADYFAEHQSEDNHQPGSWYSRVCAKIDEHESATIDGRCVVTCNYIGDGLYYCAAVCDENDEIVGLIIYFDLEEDDEEDDYWDEW